ncbi:hypothetical protein DFH07DRAFT_1067328 [Mycena maculata]|uniref:Uncharacterized protein n=1 Tax=Mycena maculata TaxID=230809 RepID=A0AAD7HL62_9AGAR|nr:hypothetical protein DFH07DRAFT_1067328 [Mycena maculata]
MLSIVQDFTFRATTRSVKIIMPPVVFGSLVAAVCTNLVLYTLEVVMACQIFGDSNPSAPGRLVKSGVCLNLIIDSVATFAGCSFLFWFQDSHWGENDDVQSRYWKVVVGVLTAGTAVAVVSQCFLLGRFWKNIRKHLLGTVFAVAILVIAVLASVAAVVICAYLQWTNPPVLVPFIWVALISNVVAALGITTVSVCQRLAIKTGAPKKNLVTRTWRAFIQTGLPGAIIVVLALIAWADGKRGDYVVALYFIQARVYSCTMLFALRYPAPARTDLWIEDMVSTSLPQKGQPKPPYSPEIFLKNEQAHRLTLCEIPEDKAVQGWYNIDLGEDVSRSSIDNDKEIAPSALVLHRNSFYQVPDEEQR